MNTASCDFDTPSGVVPPVVVVTTDITSYVTKRHISIRFVNYTCNSVISITNRGKTYKYLFYSFTHDREKQEKKGPE